MGKVRDIRKQTAEQYNNSIETGLYRYIRSEERLPVMNRNRYALRSLERLFF